ncbi:2-keto-4-pentenoate hydratase [Novosphingobium sediminis]|uniref:2-keto-4-pentenoate hydratase n=1 Tax=Novosphingobium sediminis TaxID=707214 RepID=A0A512AM90_9SPHN|nr:fumarylacetoacetate hydrolase family protein [Novosphingobium sediminis]GEO00832.1 2-keto-4-pentenoate hydratase [Novosphingobium sediminis]
MPSSGSLSEAPTRSALLRKAADTLARAEASRAPIAPLSRSIADLTTGEAYAIADLRAARRRSPLVGYKLGYTSAAMREQMGIDHPNYGRLFAASVTRRGWLRSGQLIHPRVEPEIALLLGRDLKGPEVSRAEAWGAVQAVMPSLEIVDTRYVSYEFTAPDNIADNSSAARVVLGTPVPADAAPDLCAVSVELSCDGVVVGTGLGRDAMGDPIRALAWLANALAAIGAGLRAGDIVMTGGLTRAHPAAPGARFSASFGGLGEVAAQFSEIAP